MLLDLVTDEYFIAEIRKKASLRHKHKIESKSLSPEFQPKDGMIES